MSSPRIGLRSYLSSAWLQAILCAVVATCMGLNVVQCFHIDQGLAGNIALVAAVAGVPVLLFHLAAATRKTAAIGVPLLCVAAIAGVLAMGATTGHAVFEDSYENPGLLYAVLLPVALAVFVLTRWRWSTVVLLVVGCVLCGAVQFLYNADLVPVLLLFLACVTALFVMKGALPPRKESSGAFAFAPAALCGIACAVIAALLALGVFAAVVAPLNPPTHELKLITRYHSLEEVRVSGLTDLFHQDSQDLTSQDTEQESPTNDVDPNQVQQAQGQGSNNQDNQDQSLGTGTMNPSTNGPAVDIVRYFQQNWWLLLAALAALLVLMALVVVVRRVMRSKRLESFGRLGPSGEALALYSYVCAGLERGCGLKRAGMTIREYLEPALLETEQLEKVGESCSFTHLCKVSELTAYGAVLPADNELDSLRQYARLMPKRLFKRLGPLRYLRVWGRL